MSDDARIILERMEPGRAYDAAGLRAILPGTSTERIRELMSELWINRQVERVGYAGWRRHRSAPPHVPPAAPGEVETVKPEELFDHATFADFFK